MNAAESEKFKARLVENARRTEELMKAAAQNSGGCYGSPGELSVQGLGHVPCR